MSEAVGSHILSPVTKRKRIVKSRCYAEKTSYLDAKQLIDLVNATLFANEQGMMLSAAVTVAWKHYAPFSAPSRAQVHERMKYLGRLFHEFAKSNKIPCAFIWINESLGGVHTHAIVHLPQKDWKRWREKLEAFLRERLKKHFKTDFRSERSEKAAIDVTNSDGLKPNLGYLKYLAKTLPPDKKVKSSGGNVYKYLGIDLDGPVTQVPGKRSGASESISRKAQQADIAFEPIYDVEGLKALFDRYWGS